jgi:hypothetical protein
VTYEFMYGVLVVAGLVVLLIAGLLLLVRLVETASRQGAEDSEAIEAQPAESSHRLSLAIAEALIEHRFIDPNRFNDVAQIVALKIELQKALGTRSRLGLNGEHERPPVRNLLEPKSCSESREHAVVGWQIPCNSRR